MALITASTVTSYLTTKNKVEAVINVKGKVGERVDDIKEEIINDIAFITEKMNTIRKYGQDKQQLEIKQMADFHRYSETRMFLVNTLISLEREVK